MSLSQTVRADSSRLISWLQAAAYQVFSGKVCSGIADLLRQSVAGLRLEEARFLVAPPDGSVPRATCRDAAAPGTLCSRPAIGWDSFARCAERSAQTLSADHGGKFTLYTLLRSVNLACGSPLL